MNKQKRNDLISNLAFGLMNTCDWIYESTGETELVLTPSQALSISNQVCVLRGLIEDGNFTHDDEMALFLHKYAIGVVTADSNTSNGHDISALKEAARNAYWLVNERD